MSLNRLSQAFDFTTDRSRGELWETLELMAKKFASHTKRLTKVEASDKVVAPVPIEEFPVASGQIYTGAEVPRNVGDVYWVAYASSGGIPAGSLECNGQVVDASVTTGNPVYQDLYDKIGNTFGGTDNSDFQVPDLRRRTIVGAGGSKTKGPNTTVGSTGGHETTEAHVHGHSAGHTHQAQGNQVAGGGALTRLLATTVASAANDVNVPNATNATSAHNSDSYGTGSDGNFQPSLVMTACIAFQTGPSDTIQTLPISWGSVNGQWRLDTGGKFPASAVTNDHVTIDASSRPEPVVKVSAVSGTASGSSSENKIVLVKPIPYNFRGWKPKAFRIRTRLEMTGVSANATLTLKVSDPLSAGAYLSTTKSRTITQSAGTISDGGYVDMEFTREDFGPDWKPGYALRIELLWAIPNTFTTADLYAGLLKIDW